MPRPFKKIPNGPYVDRAVLLRTIEAINVKSFASATAIAEDLRIPIEDARELARDEVRAGYLELRKISLDRTFYYFALTRKGMSEIAVAKTAAAELRNAS